MKKLLLLLSFSFLFGTVSACETGMCHKEYTKSMGHSDHHISEDEHSMHNQELKGKAAPSAQAYAHINHTMHEGMDIDFTGDADIDFLRGMIPHHQGAVDMANVQLEHGSDGILKSLTRQIILDQEREIAIMERILSVLEEKHHDHGSTQYSSSARAFKQVNHVMHMGMDIHYSGNADIDFVNGMIPHHQGAVDMAWVVIEHGKDGNVRRLAYDIINAQESEIIWMKRWKHRQNLLKAFQ